MTPRLLIADDEAAIRFSMKQYFEDLGYEVDCASSGDEARGWLARHAYDVVIADLWLDARGVEDGLGLLGAVRSDHPATRTMILTAYGSPEVEEHARRIGIDAFVHKPERLKRVAELVQRLASGSIEPR